MYNTWSRYALMVIFALSALTSLYFNQSQLALVSCLLFAFILWSHFKQSSVLLASKHFKNAEQCTECLKDVYNLHKVWRIKNSFESIDWTKINKQVYTDIDTTGAVACHGGKCEL